VQEGVVQFVTGGSCVRGEVEDIGYAVTTLLLGTQVVGLEEIHFFADDSFEYIVLRSRDEE
jgi:hypothetical protein